LPDPVIECTLGAFIHCQVSLVPFAPTKPVPSLTSLVGKVLRGHDVAGGVCREALAVAAPLNLIVYTSDDEVSAPAGRRVRDRVHSSVRVRALRIERDSRTVELDVALQIPEQTPRVLHLVDGVALEAKASQLVLRHGWLLRSATGSKPRRNARLPAEGLGCVIDQTVQQPVVLNTLSDECAHLNAVEARVNLVRIPLVLDLQRDAWWFQHFHLKAILVLSKPFDGGRTIWVPLAKLLEPLMFNIAQSLKPVDLTLKSRNLITSFDPLVVGPIDDFLLLFDLVHNLALALAILRDALVVLPVFLIQTFLSYSVSAR
jgi:hypothetical protein